MNIKKEIEQDFLRLQRILRELRFLRYNYLTHKENKERIEAAIKLLGPLSDEVKAKLEKMSRPDDDYDI